MKGRKNYLADQFVRLESVNGIEIVVDNRGTGSYATSTSYKITSEEV